MLKNLALSTLLRVSLAVRQVADTKCSYKKPCFNCTHGFEGCLKTIHGHSVECQYYHELAVTGLKDREDLRVVYWSSHDALQWEGDKIKVPQLGNHCPKCGEHNEGNE